MRGPLGQNPGEEMKEQAGGHGGGHNVSQGLGEEHRLRPEEEGQEQTTLIPVGTDVITRLGATVTFSRLATGDNVALIMEEDEGQKVIVKVYILN